MTAAMPPCVASQASCMNFPRWRTTRRPSSKLIAPAAVSAVNSPSDKTGRGVKFELRHLFLQQLKRDPAHQENSRLGVFGFGQFGVRAVETDGGEVITERGVGAVEPGPGRRKFFGQVFAHADGLRALPGKQ